MVNRLLKNETVDALKRCFPLDKHTFLLPVLAQEQLGHNKIPLAVAKMLSEKLGFAICQDIRQANFIGRTNKNADSRLVDNPEFLGTVNPNHNYLLIDDTLTLGGTLATLRGYVENRGGKVIGAMVMSAQQRSLELAPNPEILENIRTKFSDDINQFLQKEIGYGLRELTRAEAEHLYAFTNVDTLRARIAQTRYVGSGAQDGRLLEGAEPQAIYHAKITENYCKKTPSQSDFKNRKTDRPLSWADRCGIR